MLERKARRAVGAWLAILSLVLGACGSSAPARTTANSNPNGQAVGLLNLTPARLVAGEQLRVVATTAILSDVVANVGGDAIQLTALIGPGQDPHVYEPTPRDIAAIDKANIVFLNGLGLEGGLESTIRAAASRGQPVVAVSTDVKPLVDSGQDNQSSPATGAVAAHDAGNPHVWFDPGNVKIWVRNIESSLAALDPAQAPTYRANAAAYDARLDELEAYVLAEVAKLPPDRRKLVTDHEALGYFAAHYGFKIVGTVIPSASTMAEASAGDLANLINKIRAEQVPAVFVGTTANPKIAEMVAKETGARVLPLYSESLGAAGSGADTYVGMMRTDVDTIVQGLGQ